MTGQERDYDEVLSRVLHSTTDHVEPVGDGLTKIQARLAEPWLKRQWWLLRSEFTSLGWVLAVRCQSWFNAIRSGSATGADTDAVGTATTSAASDSKLRSLPVVGGLAARAAAKRPRHASSSLRFSVGPMITWLRPALAVAGAVVLVVAGVFALAGVKTGLFGFYANSTTSTTVSSSNGGGGAGKPYGSGGREAGGSTPTTQSNSAAGGRTSAPSGKASGAAAPTQSTPVSTPPATPSPTGTPTATSSPTTTPTPTPSPTNTPTPSPSPTNTSAAAPMVGGTSPTP